MGLREQAIRFRRTSWGGGWSQALATEIYLALLQAEDVQPGQNITVNLGEDGTFRLPRGGGDLDLGLTLPELEFPPFTDNPGGDELDDQDDNRPDEGTRTRTERRTVRGVYPGMILSGTGNTYTVRLYPNSSQGSAPAVDSSGVSDAVAELLAEGDGGITVEGVKQLQIAEGETIPPGTWAMVFRVTNFAIKTTETVRRGSGEREREVETSTAGEPDTVRVTESGQVERVVSRDVEISVVSRFHEMAVPVWLGSAG